MIKLESILKIYFSLAIFSPLETHIYDHKTRYNKITKIFIGAIQMKTTGEIRDPIHGYIQITELEKGLIDSIVVQRLRRIKQLAGANLTYPCAEHSRFSHSIGTMHLAGAMAQHLINLGYATEEEAQKLRIAGLLHDVGHGPFSHLFEDLLEKYRAGTTHEDLTEWLIKESEIKDILKANGFSPDEISKLTVGKSKLPYFNQVISGQFCADIMDYLLRDSFFTGVEYGHIDVQRLINSIDIVGDTLAMDTTAFYALEAFLIARYEMFKAVYFHRTVRAANIMLTRAMECADKHLKLTKFRKVEEYLALNDETVLWKILSLKKVNDEKAKVAFKLINMFLKRQLLKCTYEIIIHHKDHMLANIIGKPEIRDQIATEISRKSGIEADYVIIDVPTVPSVPHYAIQRKGAEIPIFQKTPNGTKTLDSLSKLSSLIGTLVGYLDMVRIYTLPEYREKVRKITEEVLGKQTHSLKISY
jgi:HD superfamily phosphohydrolase